MKDPESARTALGLPHHHLPRLTKFPLAVISKSVVIKNHACTHGVRFYAEESENIEVRRRGERPAWVDLLCYQYNIHENT